MLTSCLVLFTGEIRLKSGEHKYDFEYDLPKQLPTSLAAKNGYIRYEMRAIIDLVMWRDKVFSTEFTVIKPLDLNEIPHCRVKYVLFILVIR